MTRHALNTAIAAALLGTLALTGCKKKAEETPAPTPAPAETAPAPAPMEPAAPAAPAAAQVSVTAVDLGNGIGSDKKVTAPMTTFSPKDTVYASVTTATADPAVAAPAKLGVRWTFQDGQVVNEEARDISFTGPGVSAFQISKPDGWPVGKYKAEVSIEGTAVQSKEFEIK